MAGKHQGKDVKQINGGMTREHPREIQAANTNLGFVGVDIVKEVMINFPEHNEESEKPKGPW